MPESEGSSPFSPKVSLKLGRRRGSEGDGEGTIAGLSVDAEISTAKIRMNSGGLILSSEFIVRGGGARCRPSSVGSVGFRVVAVFYHIDVPSLPQ